MTRNDSSISFPLIASAAAVLALFSCAVLLLIEEEHHELCEVLLRQSLVLLRESHKRLLRDEGDDYNRKEVYIRWDRERTHQCIFDDYLGPIPRFTDDTLSGCSKFLDRIMRKFEICYVLLTIFSETAMM